MELCIYHHDIMNSLNVRYFDGIHPLCALINQL